MNYCFHFFLLLYLDMLDIQTITIAFHLLCFTLVRVSCWWTRPTSVLHLRDINVSGLPTGLLPNLLNQWLNIVWFVTHLSSLEYVSLVYLEQYLYHFISLFIIIFEPYFTLKYVLKIHRQSTKHGHNCFNYWKNNFNDKHFD